MGGHLSHLEREPHPDHCVLDASCGPVRGNIYRHGDKIVDGYLGIPYAKPPARFEKAELADPWVDTRDCTKYGPVAPPNGSSSHIVPAENRLLADEENCLTINVFSPGWKSNDFEISGRPVMVYIHGGAYEFGASSDYDDYSLSGTLPLKDVVVVTFNYRLGALGFLTIPDQNCLGNFGLWDQTLALKWIQKHIRSFGGNPDNVTVFGQSAGASSVDLLSLSPHSRDLFHKMIPMAGSAFCDFAIRTQKNEAWVCREFAKHQGFNGEGSDALLEWFKKQPVEKFSNIKGFKRPVPGEIDFVPNLDGDFLPEPLEILRLSAPKIPVMIGVCENEGLIFSFLNPNYTNARDEMKSRLAVMKNETDPEKAKNVNNQFYEYYTKDLPEDDEGAAKRKLVELIGDIMFNLGTMEAVLSLSKHGNDVYFYTFEHCNPEGFGNFARFLPFFKASHCGELRYVLGEGFYSKFEPNEADHEMIDKMTTIFSNFAKFGNPNVADWHKYEINKDGEHYRITGDEAGNESGMVKEFHGERWKVLNPIRERIDVRQELLNGK